MKRTISARRLTFIYFAFVAFALVTIHASVYELTRSDIEHLYAGNRLSKIEAYIRENIPSEQLAQTTRLEISLQQIPGLNEAPVLLTDMSLLPSHFPRPDSLVLGKDTEVKIAKDQPAYVLRKILLPGENGTTEAVLVMNNTLYEYSEQQLPKEHMTQILISLSLLLVSLFFVLKISERLTRPISDLAKQLSQQAPDTPEPITLPAGANTREAEQLLETFNNYQRRIIDLLERERSFNRYTSHELRSPLMVMKGAITLLGESDNPAFVARQRQRLQKATDEMSEFVETLLSLTKAIDRSDQQARNVTQADIEDIILNQQHLLGEKDVRWSIDMPINISIQMPEAAFHILIGNIIKNAFAWTEQGEVRVVVRDAGVKVIDSGPGLDKKQTSSEGFGLGLLLVRDICHRYGWEFTLTENLDAGCCAQISFKTFN